MEYQVSSSPFNLTGRSIFSLRHRRDKIHSLDCAPAIDELDAFQKHVTERFFNLLAADDEDLLSICWVRKLLDVFLCCQEEFCLILSENKSISVKSPADRLVREFFERSVKALDVCNAIRDGIERIRKWQKLLEIVVCALDGKKGFCEGQFRRAKKVLTEFRMVMIGEKNSSVKATTKRSRSFGDNSLSSKNRRHSVELYRSLSWSVSQSWSASRQLQAIASNIVAPKGNEIAATNGLAVVFFTMNSVLLFTMWALVAAIPCQDRGLQVHFSMPRQYSWASPMGLLHKRILEKAKKRGRENSCGLLKEIHEIERSTLRISEFIDSVNFPLSKVKEREARQRVNEFGHAFEAVKKGLDPLERRVREVFHMIVSSRTEGLASS